MVGAVDLTCWRRNADPLLIALVKTTADQITQALLTDSSAQELELLQDYLRACRRTNGIVLALNNDVVMMNDHARQVLEPGDQAVLLGQAGEALAGGRSGAVEVELPTGLTARMHCRPTRSPSPLGTAGGVVHVKLLEAGPAAGRRRPRSRPGCSCPAWSASGALWLRGCQQVQEAYEAGEWLVLEGEPGVGQAGPGPRGAPAAEPGRPLRRARRRRRGSPGWLVRVRRALLDADGDLVIRHVDQLGPRQTARAGRRPGRGPVRDQRRRPPVGGGHADPAQHRAPNLTELLRLFPATVALPPLRHHIEDLPELTTFFLGKLSQHGRLTCSPEAMKLLVRSSWPGNVEQLWQVIRRIVQRRRVGSIMPRDLPPECWTVSRRLLSPLEAMERDAIVQSLLDTDGNKAKAAESLGMSRATIYRKIHEYGIVIPAG